MKERPIPFNDPMVRALLADTKTQTRREVKLPADAKHVRYWAPPSGRSESGYADPGVNYWTPDPGGETESNHLNPCPYGQPGDRLWVQETWRHTAHDLDEARRITEDIMSGTAVDYAATYIDKCMRELGFSRDDAEMAFDFEEWRHHSKMPRWASRILLEVTAVRVERLQDISEADAQAEGARANDPCDHTRYSCAEIGCSGPGDYRGGFKDTWESINGPGSWGANPWVWVVEFKRVTL